MSTDVSEVRAASIIRAVIVAARTSETSVDIQLRTRQYISEDSELHTRRRENLKSRTLMFILWTNNINAYRTVNIKWLQNLDILNNAFERGSSVSMVSGYGLDYRAIEVRSPAGAKDFSCSLCVQTGSGAHPASCTMGTVGLFPGVKHGRGVTLTTHPHLVPRSWMRGREQHVLHNVEMTFFLAFTEGNLFVLLNLNSVNQLIFVMVKCGVLFEVRTELLNNI
jgi:hypothetical protein